MSKRLRRRNEPGDDDPHNDDRWMASYMDMVTVLMCMFIVLFAMSSVDKAKFEQLRDSLAEGFGGLASVSSTIIGKTISPVPPSASPSPTGLSALERAKLEVNALQRLQEEIRADLKARGLTDTVDFQLDQRGLTIRLIGSETFFSPNSTELSERTRQVLAAIAPVLVRAHYQVSVEGHADYRGSPFPFPTVWELSAGRATQVLRYLVEEGGIEPATISSVGFGSARPATTGTSTEDMALNRRVDIAVLSGEPEAIRALIPKVLGTF